MARPRADDGASRNRQKWCVNLPKCHIYYEKILKLFFKSAGNVCGILMLSCSFRWSFGILLYELITLGNIIFLWNIFLDCLIFVIKDLLKCIQWSFITHDFCCERFSSLSWSGTVWSSSPHFSPLQNKKTTQLWGSVVSILPFSSTVFFQKLKKKGK